MSRFDIAPVLNIERAHRYLCLFKTHHINMARLLLYIIDKIS